MFKKTSSMLDPAEHDISTVHKNENTKNQGHFLLQNFLYVAFIAQKNAKMRTEVGISTLMSKKSSCPAETSLNGDKVQ